VTRLLTNRQRLLYTAATAFFAALAAWGRREWNLTGGTR
jgi:hypothetical protein